MKKRVKLCILFTIALMACGAFAACDPQGQSSNPPDPPITAELTLVKNKLDMILGDTAQIKASYTELDGATPIAYASSNAAVANVSANGVVEAMGIGSATITVTYGGETQSCVITVTAGDYVPILEFKETPEEEITVLSSEIINLGVRALFNGKYFDDVEVSYEYTDDGIGYVNGDGYFVPQKSGSTSVILTATWRGMTNSLMQKTVNLTVYTATSVTVNGGEQREFELFVAENVNGVAYATQTPFEVKLLEEDGVTEIEGVEITVKEGTDLVEYKDGVLSVLGNYKIGTATIVLEAETEEYGSVYHEWTVKVSLPASEDKTELCYDYDLSKPGLTAEQLTQAFGTASSIKAAYSNGKLLPQTDGAFGGLDVKKDLSEQTITLFSETKAVDVSLVVYTRIFYERADLVDATIKYSYFDVNKNKTQLLEDGVLKEVVTTLKGTETICYQIDGVYALGADIDWGTSGNQLRHSNATQGANWQCIGSKHNNFLNWENVGFVGTFDGKGHTISNAKLGAGGLFGFIGGGATVKNFAMKDISYGSSVKNTSALASDITSVPEKQATFENIYVSYKAGGMGSVYHEDTTALLNDVDAVTSSTNNSTLAWMVSPNAKWNNIVVDLSAVGAINRIGGGIFGYAQPNTAYGWTEDRAGVFQNMTNTLVISSAPLLIQQGNGNDSAGVRKAVVVDAYNKADVWATATINFSFATNPTSKGGPQMMTSFEACTYATEASLNRFATTAEFTQGVKDGAANGFNGNYWTVDNINGTVTWGTRK